MPDENKTEKALRQTYQSAWNGKVVAREEEQPQIKEFCPAHLKESPVRLKETLPERPGHADSSVSAQLGMRAMWDHLYL